MREERREKRRGKRVKCDVELWEKKEFRGKKC